MSQERILLSPPGAYEGVYYGYHFYEEGVGFGTLREVRGDSCSAGGCGAPAEIIFQDLGEGNDSPIRLKPPVEMFALRPDAARRIIESEIDKIAA
jgi:hypothetical protein